MSQNYGREVDLLKIRLALLRQNHTRTAAGAIGADMSRLELRSVANREQASAIFGGFRLAEIVIAAKLDGKITNGETK